eukprot:gene14236-biopygen2054
MGHVYVRARARVRVSERARGTTAGAQPEQQVSRAVPQLVFVFFPRKAKSAIPAPVCLAVPTSCYPMCAVIPPCGEEEGGAWWRSHASVPKSSKQGSRVSNSSQQIFQQFPTGIVNGSQQLFSTVPGTAAMTCLGCAAGTWHCACAAGRRLSQPRPRGRSLAASAPRRKHTRQTKVDRQPGRQEQARSSQLARKADGETGMQSVCPCAVSCRVPRAACCAVLCVCCLCAVLCCAVLCCAV